MLVAVPARFFNHHAHQEPSAPEPVRRTRDRVWLDNQSPGLFELLSAAESLVSRCGPGRSDRAAACDPALLRSAASTVTCLKRAGVACSASGRKHSRASTTPAAA